MQVIWIGLLLLGLAESTRWVSTSSAIHALTTGAIGGMILAMMTRVSVNIPRQAGGFSL